MAGSAFVFVEVLAACLFRFTRDVNNNGYYPSSGMVTPFHVFEAVFLVPHLVLLSWFVLHAKSDYKMHT